MVSPVNNPIATLVRNPKGTPFKPITTNNPDGTISETSNLIVSFGIAVMYRIETKEQSAEFADKVANEKNGAVLHASFKGIDVGEEFVIFSPTQMEKRLGIPKADRNRQLGIHKFSYEGKSYKAVAALKENLLPSTLKRRGEITDQASPNPLDQAPPNPLDQYSLTGKSQELEKMAADQVMLLGTLVIMGQLTAFFAAANVGKTLLVIYFLLEAIREGRVKASHVYYINVDDNPHGLLQKLRLAEEAGFHMIADGHQGFKVKLFVQLIEDLIQTDQAVGVVIILDTLKKFTNLMDKSRVSQFTQLCRRFVMKGGTLIALAHTNKHPGTDGKPIYAGTSDVVDDFDCAYTLTPLTESAPGGDKVVVFDNIKRRGNVAQRAAYSYSTKEDQSYDALVASVQPIDDAHMLQVKQVEQTVSDTVVVDTIVACIRQGFNKKMALAQEAADRAGVSKRKAIQVIECYTGTDQGVHKWSFAVHERGAKVFALLEDTAQP